MTEAWGPDDDEPRRHNGPVRVRVPAKINLHLAVGPLRADGFHELNTVYHAISLFDELTARNGDTLALTMEGEGAGTLALDETNLIIRAARALAARCRVPAHARLHLRKTIPLRNKQFVFNHTSKDHTTYESARRALYLPIIRNHLYDMLEQFDYPDPTMPTGSRNSTVIAPQALIMMNAPVVMESASRLAAKVADKPEEQRLDQIYLLLYGRPPSEHEKTDALAMVREFSATEKPERAWALLCGVVINRLGRRGVADVPAASEPLAEPAQRE